MCILIRLTVEVNYMTREQGRDGIFQRRGNRT